MSYEFIEVAREGHVTVVTLNRPAALNSLIAPMHWELHRAFEDFAADPGQWAAILTGAGERAFCAGSDLKGISESGGLNRDLPPSGYGGLVARTNLDKPVIAAVNGVALGGGFEVALACDLIVAADTARFGLPEPRVGLAAIGGGLHNLPRQIPLKQAMGLILTGKPVSPQEGLAFGFVNEVAPAAGLMDVARRWAVEICAGSPLAVQAAKQVVMRGLDEACLQDAIANQWEQPALKAMLASDDAQEGPLAFAEKRPPQWAGR